MGTVNFLRKTTVTFTYLKPFTKWWKVCVQCSVFLFFFILHLEKLLVFYSPSLRNFQKYWVEFVATCSVTVKKWQVNLGRNWWMKSNKPLTHLIIFSSLTLDWNREWSRWYRRIQNCQATFGRNQAGRLTTWQENWTNIRHLFFLQCENTKKSSQFITGNI